MKKTISLSLIFLLIANIASAKGVGLREVPALITSTYIFGLIFAGVFLLLAAVVSNAIKFQGGPNPRDSFKRRMWFWIFAILGPVSFFIYNFLMVIPTIKKGPAADKFSMHPPVSTAVLLVVYILVGFILSKVMKKGKIGNWFPSKN
jgi:hypothetical protein